MKLTVVLHIEASTSLITNDFEPKPVSKTQLFGELSLYQNMVLGPHDCKVLPV